MLDRQALGWSRLSNGRDISEGGDWTTISDCLLFIRLLHHRRCLATSDTHVGCGAVLTDYRLIACTTTGRSSSVTLEPAQLSPPWTLPMSLSLTSYCRTSSWIGMSIEYAVWNPVMKRAKRYPKTVNEWPAVGDCAAVAGEKYVLIQWTWYASLAASSSSRCMWRRVSSHWVRGAQVGQCKLQGVAVLLWVTEHAAAAAATLPAGRPPHQTTHWANTAAHFC